MSTAFRALPGILSGQAALRVLVLSDVLSGHTKMQLTWMECESREGREGLDVSKWA